MRDIASCCFTTCDKSSLAICFAYLGWVVAFIVAAQLVVNVTRERSLLAIRLCKLSFKTVVALKCVMGCCLHGDVASGSFLICATQLLVL